MRDIGPASSSRYIFSSTGERYGITPTETIWFNGKLVPWDDAKVHVLAHGLQYGTGVFEGMKSYPTADGPAIFRLDAHLERFYKSAELYDLADSLFAGRRWPRPASRSSGPTSSRRRTCGRSPSSTPRTLSVWTKECPVTVAIAAVPTGKYLANADAGVRVTVSPIRKFDNSAIPAWAKACGQYINSARAVNDAQRRGFDEALLLNSQGLVAEGSGENLFVVKNGAHRHQRQGRQHPDGRHPRVGPRNRRATSASRRRVAPISVEDVLGADELFFTGTAVEVTRDPRGRRPRRSAAVNPAPVTRRIQETFNQAVRGQLPQYRRWLSFVRQPVLRVADSTSDG